MLYINKQFIGKATLYSLFFLFFFNSCQNKKEVNISIKKFKTIAISKKDYGSGAFNLYTGEGSSSYLINYNKDLKEIRLINIYTNKTDKIPISDSINFRMIYVKNLDTIILISKQENKITIVNAKGKVLSEYHINLSFKSTEYNISAVTPNQISLKGNYLYINCFPKIDKKKKAYFAHYFNLFLNLKDSSAGIVPLTYPSIYSLYDHWWGGLGNKLTQCVNNKSEIVYSFAMCDSLFIWDGKTIKSYLVERSKYLTHFPPEIFNNKQAMNSRYVIEYQRKSPRYANIKYDIEKKLYYRVIAHRQELKNKQGENNLNYDRSWSVQIIDTNLKVIDEVYFEPEKYNYVDFSVTEKGFCVSRHYDDSDSLIYWDFFKVVKL